MKYRLTVTVDLKDPGVYDLDSDGWPVGDPDGRVERSDVAIYVAEAVAVWGGSGPPGSPFFPRNIRSVRVSGQGIEPIEYEV